VEQGEDVEVEGCEWSGGHDNMMEVAWRGSGRHMSGGERGDVTARRGKARD
jgi:hypothetical protein